MNSIKTSLYSKFVSEIVELNHNQSWKLGNYLHIQLKSFEVRYQISFCSFVCVLIYIFRYYADKLYFSSSDQPDRIPANSTWLAFSNDPSLVYTAFFADFGPLDLGLTCKFCQQLHEKLQQASETRKSVVYFASSEPQKRSNCATLLLAYLVSICPA